MSALVFLDTETTSLDPVRRRPWEIALIRRDDEGEREVHLFVDGVDLSCADPMALRIGGFYDRHPDFNGGNKRPGEGDEFEEECARIVERVTRGAHLVGAVPSFDATTLDAMLRRYGLLPAWHHRLRCVETLTAGHLRREVGGLRDCAAALGVQNEAEHTALGDARTAMAIWDRVMAS